KRSADDLRVYLPASKRMSVPVLFRINLFAPAMNFFRSFQVAAATLFLAVGLYAQDAQELIAAASKVYADTGAYVGELDSRTVSWGFPDPDAEKADGDAAYRVLGVRYQRIQIKIRKPSDYLLGVQNFRAGPASARPGGESWMFLARKDGDRPKHGAFTG